MVYLNKCVLPCVHTQIGLKQIYMKLRQQQSHLLQGEGNSLHVLLPCSPKPCYSQTPHRRICKIPTASHSLYNVHTDSQHSFSGLEQCGEWRRRKDPCNTGLKEIKAPQAGERNWETQGSFTFSWTPLLRAGHIHTPVWSSETDVQQMLELLFTQRAKEAFGEE